MSTDWQAEVRSRLVIEPTISAMQRHLLFTMRSASVQATESTPGRFHTVVEWEEAAWEGTGDSAAEAMGRVLLAMTGSQAIDNSPASVDTEDRMARR
jgi:hypothetical protein